jgi:hypothetical protein
MSDNVSVSSWETWDRGWTSPWTSSEGSESNDSMKGSISDILETKESKEEQVRSPLYIIYLSTYLSIYFYPMQDPMMMATEAELVAHVQEVQEAVAVGWLAEDDIVAHLQEVAEGMGMGVRGWEIPMPWPHGWGPYALVWQMANAAVGGGDLEAALFVLLSTM